MGYKIALVRYIGVDPGSKRVGLAIGDSSTGVVEPVAVFAYRGLRRCAEELSRWLKQLGADALVIGLPVTADGREAGSARRSMLLKQELESMGIRVELQPEYLTSKEARWRAREAGLPPNEPIDHLAAAVILEDFLCRRRG